MNYANVEGDEIVIRIPIEHLSGAAYAGLDAVGCEENDAMDYNMLAHAIVFELNSESEWGTTPVNVALDQAVIESSEQGHEAFAYLDE